MNDYLIGNLVGLTQTSIGYPFDTIKTNLVNGYTGKIHFSKLLRGIKYPLVGSCMNNTLVFGNYHHFHKYFENSPYASTYAGAAAGFIGSFILNPFETRKVQYQVFSSKNIPQNLPIFSALNYMVTRETLSNAIYFSVYDYCHNKKEISPFISGGLAGINSWLWTFPIDALRIRKQLHPELNIKELWKLAPISRGITVTLIRAFLVNGSGFYVYDLLKN